MADNAGPGATIMLGFGHECRHSAGMVDVAQFPGDTVDIRPEMKPTFLCDAHTLNGVPVEDYDLILADPPYSAEDADHYGTPLVSRHKVVEALSHRMQPGAHLAWLDQAQPMYAKARLKPEAAIPFRCEAIGDSAKKPGAPSARDRRVRHLCSAVRALRA